MVDYSGLENRRAERHRGFESLSLRKFDERKKKRGSRLSFLVFKGFVVMYHYVLIMYRGYLILFTVHNKVFTTGHQMKI